MKKVLTSMFVVILSLTIALSSFSALALSTGVSGGTFDESSITAPDTVTTISGGWGSGTSNPVYSQNNKIFTTTAGTNTQQMQCYIDVANFSTLLASTDKIAIDFYPAFTNQNGSNLCYLQYSFDNSNWSADKDFSLKSGEKYTLVVDSTDVPSTANCVVLKFQNYDDSILPGAKVIGSAPYAYTGSSSGSGSSGSGSSSSSSSSSDSGSESGGAGGAFDPSNITFPDTAATLSGGWGSGAANPVYAADAKSFTLNGNSDTNQIQCFIDVVNFSTVLAASDKIAIDFYPTFTNQNGSNLCYLLYSFDNANWSADKAISLKSGEKYTLVVNSADVPSSAKCVVLKFQNYDDKILSGSKIIGSAPYAYPASSGGSGSDSSSSSSSSSSSGSGSGSGSDVGGVGDVFDPSSITAPVTPATLSGGWGSGALNPVYSQSNKIFTLTAKSTPSGYVEQLQCWIDVNNFSAVLAASDKVAIDIYPSFTNQNGADVCNFKYSFDNSTFSGDFDNQMKSGKKYTLILNSADIPANANFMLLQFQNYQDVMADNAVIIGSAPYPYGDNVVIPSDSTPTEPSTPTQPSGSTFPAYDASKANFKISNATAYQGKTVEVPITIGNNPGLFSAKLNVKYDKSVLTLSSVKAGTVFAAGEMYSGPTTADVLNLAFESADLMNNNTKNGVLATLVFTVNSNAKLGSTAITFANYSADEYINCDGNNVPFTFGNGVVTVKTAPTASKTLATPSNLKVTLKSNKKATISWSSVSGAKGYQIYRKVNSGKWAAYKTTTKTSLTVGSLAKGKTYSYKVRAYSSTLISAFTSAKSVKTYKLGKVKKVKAKVSGKTVTLTWSKTKNAKQYKVYVSTKKKSGYKAVKTVKAKKAKIKLKSNKQYYIKVRALRKVGTSKQKVYGSYSAVKSVKTK